MRCCQVVEQTARRAPAVPNLIDRASHESSQREESLKMPFRLDRDKQVRRFRRGCALRVGDDHESAAPAVWREPAPGVDRIALPVTRVTGDRVGAPKDNEVGPVAHLAKCCGDFSNLLLRNN